MFRKSKEGPSEAGSELLQCSFCESSQADVRKLIAGPDGVHICDTCVGLCVEVLDQEGVAPEAVAVPPVPVAAAEVARILSQRAPGQGAAVVTLSRVFAAHSGRSAATTGRAPRVLLVGPRGSGKTHLARSLLGVTQLPGVDIDLNRVTATGYVGEDVENLLHDLLLEAGEDFELAQRGVLILDGLHHLAAVVIDGRVTRDIGARDVQRHLLRVLGGSRCVVGPGPRHPAAEGRPFDPSGLLCVVTATADLPPDPVVLRDGLRREGVLGELLARIDLIVPVPRPNVDDMEKILTVLAQNRGARPFDPPAARFCAEHAAGSEDGIWALERLVMRANLANPTTEPVRDAEARTLTAGF